MNTPRSKPSFHLFIVLALLAALLGSAIGVIPAYASTVTVTKTADTDDGVCNSDCSLREAIATAGVGDTITFDSTLSGGTIYLASTLSLAQNVTIDGSALAAQITISGDTDNDTIGDVRVFSISSGATVTLNSLTITKGSVSATPGGGGIFNDLGSTLTVTNSTLSGNTNSGGPGGGIRNDGTLTVTNSTFSDNAASGGSGGGIRSIGTLTVTNSTFSGNSTTASGGGIYSPATGGALTVTNSTFSANSAGSQGGGIYYAGSATFNYANTIIANSTSGGDCGSSGTIGTNTNNLVEDGSCSTNGTNFLTGDPALDSLANNGGATQTFALLTGSSAIDAGDDTTCANSPVNNLDQRGVTRPVGAHCDIGAYEPEPVVTKLADTNDGVCDSDCSLREAIATVSSGNTILFDSSLSGGTIYLASTLTIAQNMTIDGSALASKITISGDSDNNGTGDVRVLFVHSGMTVTLDSLIITKGNGTAPSGEAIPGGGGIQNNTGNNSGAALTVKNSIISGNSATGNGGGILNTSGSTLTITNSTISGNSATGNGGGILSDGNLLAITDSTLSGNSAAGDGGGVRNGNIMTLTNSTISGNSASVSGGGIYNDGSLTAKNNTLSGNSASVSGGGIFSDNTLNATNNIIANSTSGGDCFGEIDTNLNNLVEDGTCPSNGVGFKTGDPGLDSLADNGGPTQTFALGLGSSAIDAGDDTTCTNSPVNNLDQRGVTRPLGTHCDIGALEQDITAPTVNSFTATTPALSLDIPITAFTASDNFAVTGYIITESSTPPSASAGGWIGSAPTTFTVAGGGFHTLYPWAKDVSGNVSSVYGSPIVITVCAPIAVTSNADSGAGSLRQAIADACDGGTINFNASLSGDIIHLTSTLDISKNLTIDGSDLDEQITISGDTAPTDGTGNVRVFHTTSPTFATITLNSLIITKGLASGPHNPNRDDEGGGLLANIHTTVNIINSTFSDNSAYNGGAISVYGTVNIIDSTFSSNSSTNGAGGGGAILNSQVLTIKNSTFSNNTANGGGGALFNASPNATIANSTFSGNVAAIGGAITTTSNLTITNSTISGNSAYGSSGGGLTIQGHTTNLINTIIANSITRIGGLGLAGDCLNVATIGTNLNNLIEDGSCSASLSGDPSLGALADNGGSTKTLALLAGSTAIDAGDDTTCAAAPVSNLDQRGVTRPNGAHCDIGAYEYVDVSAPAVTAFAATSPSNLNVPITTFTASDDAIVAGYLITESSTPPSSGAAGWSGTAPTTYAVGSDGAYSLYPWAKDAMGHVSPVFGSPASVSVDTSAPTVVSSVRVNLNPTTAASVKFVVTFSEPVTGVDAADFRLTTTGSISGAVVSGVSGSGTTYTVTVNTGSGSGTIRLDVADNDTIVDTTSNQLGGSGAGNGAFASGEAYTIPLHRIYLSLVMGK